MGRPRDLDWAWATRTGGALSRRQKLALTLPLARVVARYPASRIRTALGVRGSAALDLDALRWPDSQLARDATAEARDTLTPHIVEHSVRTWVFGKLLAHVAGIPVDDELTFVACMLHDTHLEHPTPGRCFAVVGGEHAERFVLDRDVPADRAAAIGAAIGGHITVGAAENLADPAGFVSAGAFIDITGYGLHAIDPAWVDQLHHRHPRHDLRRHLLTAWAGERSAVPTGRAQWLTRYGAFPLLATRRAIPGVTAIRLLSGIAPPKIDNATRTATTEPPSAAEDGNRPPRHADDKAASGRGGETSAVQAEAIVSLPSAHAPALRPGRAPRARRSKRSHALETGSLAWPSFGYQRVTCLWASRV